jgi:hypothetical protein
LKAQKLDEDEGERIYDLRKLHSPIGMQENLQQALLAQGVQQVVALLAVFSIAERLPTSALLGADSSVPHTQTCSPLVRFLQRAAAKLPGVARDFVHV